jgi:2-desacetyl-2-hydroxyethyl bacteriochlorophyllide A dehydrogenase
MQVLVCEEPGKLGYMEKDIPATRAGYALLRIRRIGICGTDLHAFEGTQPFFSYPRILGHELSGDLVDPNGAVGFIKDEAVTFIPYFSCGKCIACRSGKPNCCVKMEVCGVHADGGMAEYLLVPNGALVHGQGLTYDELALVEPLAIGAHGVGRAGVRPGEHVLVIGAGPIGLGTMEFAKIARGKVIAMDMNQDRLDFCRNQLKIDQIINAAENNVMDKLLEITNGDMPEVVIDATGNWRAIDTAFQYMAHGGRYVLVGLQKGEISFSHPEFHKREATLMSSRNATRTDFEHVIASMKSGLVDPASYITHNVAFEDVKNSFESWIDPANGVIKAMVTIR